MISALGARRYGERSCGRTLLSPALMRCGQNSLSADATATTGPRRETLRATRRATPRGGRRVGGREASASMGGNGGSDSSTTDYTEGNWAAVQANRYACIY